MTRANGLDNWCCGAASCAPPGAPPCTPPASCLPAAPAAARAASPATSARDGARSTGSDGGAAPARGAAGHRGSRSVAGRRRPIDRLRAPLRWPPNCLCEDGPGSGDQPDGWERFSGEGRGGCTPQRTSCKNSLCAAILPGPAHLLSATSCPLGLGAGPPPQRSIAAALQRPCAAASPKVGYSSTAA
eukprot:scaffold3282_cov101-Isochrysis_galbana.AAC.9